MIKLIIFDYDGVIVDSFSNVYDIYKIICRETGKLCPETLEDFRKIYGHSSSECYSRLGFTAEERIKGDVIFREEILKKNPELFEGIIQVLEELHKRYKLGIISSSYKEEIEQKLKKNGISTFFDFILARKDPLNKVNKTKPIKNVLDKYGLNPREVLLVGDRNIDFTEGSEAGLDNILLVEYGWGYNPEEIPEYDLKFLVKNPKDILEAIEKLDSAS